MLLLEYKKRWMTQAEYSRHRGTSRAYITNLIKKELLPRSAWRWKGKKRIIDSNLADQALSGNLFAVSSGGRPYNNLANKRFGRIVALKYVLIKQAHGKRGRWLCVCDCGNFKKVDASSLRNGGTKSCGCMVVKKIFPKEAYKKYSSGQRNSQYLTDNYIKTIIFHRYNINRKSITPEMIELKREQLIFYRLTKEV